MYITIKNICDKLAAALLLLLLFWMVLLLALCTFLLIKERPFFLQKRMGRYGRSFMILKLKTFPRKYQNVQQPQLPPYFQWLRDTGFDEIPQLWNILIGQMSFIGPRPLLVEYKDLFSDFQNQRHLCKPGVLGLAQVKGGNAICWKHRFKLDVFYVDHLSFCLDLKIIVSFLMNAGNRKDKGQFSDPFIR
jgi:undecaprenyl phosphate N,N'-diacetylbacillosamine 1-phosphate transferase